MHGGFMVTEPGRDLPDGRPVGRLIMDVMQMNDLMMVLEGYLDSWHVFSSF